MTHAPLAFLHTSPVHITTFDRLVHARAPGLPVAHHVDPALLSDAQTLGADSPHIVERVETAMRQAAAAGAQVVVCTCSTLGGAAERTPLGAGRHAARIDRAMADSAALQGPRVLVVAALESTLHPTAALIEDSAARLQRRVTLDFLALPQAWALFQRGEHAAYLESIVAALRADARPVDVVVLAQASMAAAAEALMPYRVPILSSPSLGVERVLALLRC